MAVLANIRHENFARHVAAGTHPRLAARRVGYMSATSGNVLLRDPRIAARIDELLEEAMPVVRMEISEMLQYAEAGVRGDIRDVLNPDAIKRDAFGQPLRDEHGNTIPSIEFLNPFEMTNEGAAMVQSFELDRNGQLKIKLVDRKAYLDILLRCKGAYKDNLSLTGVDGGPIQTISADMTPEQAAQLYQMTLGK